MKIMQEESAGKIHKERSWLERLSHSIQREPHNREDLIDMLRDCAKDEILGNDALEMIEGVLEVSELQARNVMIPRSHMILIDESSTLDELLPIIIESGHSRFPVVEEKGDEIIGVLFAKDLLKHFFTSNEHKPFILKEYLRPATFIPESKRVDVLLKEFRQNKSHMAIVVDEYGGISGLITIEDILEEIVGEIEDEHDATEDENIVKLSETTYAVRGLTPIEEFNEYFEASLSDEEFETIGGLIMHELGHMPKINETASIDQFNFKVLQFEKRRIQLLEVICSQENE